jgi:EmrB/QacA subfamily drug resistance transporter
MEKRVRLEEYLMEDKLNKKIVLLIATLGAFIVPFMVSSINIALPSIGKEFAMNTVLLNWVVLSFMLSLAVFILPFGRLADIFGRKRLLLYGMSFFTLASIICGISFNAGTLIASRVLQGISSAMISVTLVSILSSVYFQGERGRALGINVAATYIGLSSGPFLGGFLTKYLGWRSIFFFVVPIGIIVIIILLNLKQNWAEAKGEEFDYKGSIIYSVGLFVLVYGLSLVRSFWGPILMLMGFILMIIFGFYENRVKNPILNMTLIKNNKILTFSSLAALINYSATFAISYLLSLYLQYIKGFGPQQAGLIMVAQPLVQALFSPISGELSDRIEPQMVASVGMAITSAGLAFFIFLTENTNIKYIIAALLVVGFGFALFSSPNTNAIMGSVTKKYYGVASGIIGSARSVGQAFSMGITSLVMVFYMGNVQISRSSHPNFIISVKVTFIILTILCFFGIFASIARGKISKIKESPNR